MSKKPSDVGGQWPFYYSVFTTVSCFWIWKPTKTKFSILAKSNNERRLKCKAAWNWRAQREVMVWPLINGYTLPGIESLGKEALNHVKRERVNRVEESSLGRRKWLFSNFRSNEGGLDSCVRILFYSIWLRLAAQFKFFKKELHLPSLFAKTGDLFWPDFPKFHILVDQEGANRKDWSE